MIGATDETRDRFLPSVDRLEDAMRAGMRALDADRVDEALERFNFALKLKPEYDAAWLARGRALRRLKDFEGALQSFAQALRANRESEEAWMALASTLHGMGRKLEEIEAYDELLKVHPRFVQAWVNKGAALHEARDYRGAIACYDAALAIRPEHAPAWNNKGVALLRLHDEAGADRCFSEALHLDPDFFDAIVNRVLLLQKRGRHGEVVLWADRALRFRSPPWLWYVKGLAHVGLLEATFAIQAFERALELRPDFPEAKGALKEAKGLRQRVDMFRGVYECFGTHEAEDPGCAECEIAARCRQVSP